MADVISLVLFYFIYSMSAYFDELGLVFSVYLEINERVLHQDV